MTNGGYRRNPVEGNIGEAAGLLIAFPLSKKIIPPAERNKRIN